MQMILSQMYCHRLVDLLIVNAQFLLLKKYFTIAEWFNQFYTSTQNYLTVHCKNVLVVVFAHKKILVNVQFFFMLQFYDWLCPYSYLFLHICFFPNSQLYFLHITHKLCNLGNLQIQAITHLIQQQCKNLTHNQLT